MKTPEICYFIKCRVFFHISIGQQHRQFDLDQAPACVTDINEQKRFRVIIPGRVSRPVFELTPEVDAAFTALEADKPRYLK
jgi:hypothetical protein